MYTIIEDPKEEPHDALLDSDGDSHDHEDDQKHRPNGIWRALGFFIITSTLSCVAGILIGYQQHDLDDICLRHTSHYSPVLSNFKIKYHQQRFNGSLFKENVFRQNASPEVDAAWEGLGANYRPIRVPVDEAARSGLSSDHVQINEAHGGGYPANVEGFHHLHCLNLLRQSLYYNYDYYLTQKKGAFKNDDYVVRKHVSHCLDILRQQIICTIDTGVMGQVWVHPEHPAPFVDFNTEHTCRNFEDIRAWAEAHQLPLDTPGDFLMPPKGVLFESIP